MDKHLFQSFVSQGYNRIPVYKEIVSDLDTPLTLYMKLANQPYSYLLESVQGGEQWARYSMIGLPCSSRIEISGKTIKEINNHQTVLEKTIDNPLDYIDEVIKSYEVPYNIEGLPNFLGGLVGYFGYDIIHLIEPNISKGNQIDELSVPDVLLLRSEEVVVVDNLLGKSFLVVLAKPTDLGYESANNRLNQLFNQIQTSLNTDVLTLNKNLEKPQVSYKTPKEKFITDVDKVKEYIVEGDIFQAVLSQRMSAPFEKDPLDLYRSMRMLNPSPYMYYFDLDDFYIVGSSPEVLVKIQDNQATVRPIAGTRPRGKTPAEDIALEKELLADPKELAEHLMLIDLGRNDIGRIAKPGTVKLVDKMVIERYSHVMHIVSEVCGEVLDDKTAIDVFKAVFPAGTLSGAPKIRAMQILNELEPVKRNIYAGAVGYLSWNGEMDTAIAIRTAIIKENTIHVQAGGGLVYDSVSENEWQESINKSASVITANQMIDKNT